MSNFSLVEMQRQYLTFVLNDEYFGIDILRVQEIRGWTNVRKIPNMPNFIKGVLNLRGKVVPIVDLRIRFGAEQVEYLPTTVVIVVTINVGSKTQIIGLVVDAVADVIVVNDGEFTESPPMGIDVETRFMEGVVMREDSITVILNLDAVLKENEMIQLSEMKT